jgi:uncharacterized YigZ family protein
MTRFKTISQPTEGLYKEKGSRFIAYAYPINTVDDAESHLSRIRTKHHDSRHVCYAYRLGATKEIHKASDAGEPANTAGAPIFGQIRSFELTNVLVIVVRYFGGIKLGVGGLIAAYREAAKDALQQAEVIEDFEKEQFTVASSYEELLSLQKLLKEYKLEIISQDFAERCTFTVSTPIEDAKKLRNLFFEKGWLLG